MTCDVPNFQKQFKPWLSEERRASPEERDNFIVQILEMNNESGRRRHMSGAKRHQLWNHSSQIRFRSSSASFKDLGMPIRHIPR
jgi:hypothetical protein